MGFRQLAFRDNEDATQRNARGGQSTGSPPRTNQPQPPDVARARTHERCSRPLGLHPARRHSPPPSPRARPVGVRAGCRLRCAWGRLRLRHSVRGAGCSVACQQRLTRRGHVGVRASHAERGGACARGSRVGLGWGRGGTEGNKSTGRAAKQGRCIVARGILITRKRRQHIHPRWEGAPRHAWHQPPVHATQYTHTHTHVYNTPRARLRSVPTPWPCACSRIAPVPPKQRRLQRARAQERTPSGPRSASTRASSRRTARRRALSRRRVGGGAWEEAGEEARGLVARTPRHHQADESTTGARGARQLSWAGRDWRWLPRSDTRSTGGPWGTGSFSGQRSWRWLPRHRPSPSRHTSVQRQVRPSVRPRPPPSRAYVRTSPSPPPPAPLAPWPAACARA